MTAWERRKSVAPPSIASAVSRPLAPAASTIWFWPAASRTMSAVPLAMPSWRVMGSMPTPCCRRVSISSSPNASRPTTPSIETAWPRRATALAWFAPLPPAERRKLLPTTVSPGAGSCATSMNKSMFRLPTTVIMSGRSFRDRQRKQSPLARFQPAQLECAEAASVQTSDVDPLGCEHTFHLVIAALDEFHAGLAGAHDFKLRRETGLGFAVQQQRAGSEERDKFRPQVGIDGDLVDLRYLMSGRSPALDESAVIGQEQQSSCVAVEPADAGDRRTPPRPASRQSLIDRWPIPAVVGTDKAGGLMEQCEQAIGRFDGLAIDQDFDGQRLDVGLGDGRAANEHATCPNPGCRFTAAAIAVAGENLIQAAGFFGDHFRGRRAVWANRQAPVCQRPCQSLIMQDS